MNKYLETTNMLRKLLDLDGKDHAPPTVDGEIDTLEMSRKAEEPEKVVELTQFLSSAHDVDELTRPARAARTNSGPAEILLLEGFKKRPTRKPEKFEITDHVEMGRIVAQWAVDPDSRPQSAAELADQLRGVAKVPASIRNVEFAQGAEDTLVINLPAQGVLESSLDEVNDPLGDDPRAPQFYADDLRPGVATILTPQDFLLARIGDISTSLSP